MQKQAINNDFVESVSIIKKADDLYRKKLYLEALRVLESAAFSIQGCSKRMESLYFDFIASLLWKLNDHVNAKLFWEKALNLNSKNRHANICMNILCDTETENNLFLLFLQIKISEISSTAGISPEEIEPDIIITLSEYWEENLNDFDFSDFSEAEIVDYFINIKLH